MTHPNLELMSMLIEEEKRRVKAISAPVDLPLRPGPVRRSIGKALVSLGEHIGGAHLQHRQRISPRHPSVRPA
jgi:hypothetical protein